MRFIRGSLDVSPPQRSPSGWGAGNSPLSSHTPSPRKYHIAPPSSSPTSSHGDCDTSHVDAVSVGEVVSGVGVFETWGV